jgi:hypothetical protein
MPPEWQSSQLNWMIPLPAAWTLAGLAGGMYLGNTAHLLQKISLHCRIMVIERKSGEAGLPRWIVNS